MTDQIPADDLRRFIARCRTAVNGRGSILLDELEALLPDPPRPTLADMTPQERAACRRMQADVEGRSERYVIAAPYDGDADVALIGPDWEFEWIEPECVTPRPDLPRMEWPRDTGIPGVAIDVPVTDPDLIQRISDEAPTGTIVAEANLNATVRNGRYWHSAEEGHLTLAEALFHAPHEWDATAPITVVRWGE